MKKGLPVFHPAQNPINDFSTTVENRLNLHIFLENYVCILQEHSLKEILKLQPGIIIKIVKNGLMLGKKFKKRMFRINF